MTTVVIVDDAEAQLREIVEWWEANRPAAPTLVVDELERCISLLATSPGLGPRFYRTSVPGVRRLVLRRTKHLVYYVHDTRNAVVYIIAVWVRRRRAIPSCAIRNDDAGRDLPLIEVRRAATGTIAERP